MVGHFSVPAIQPLCGASSCVAGQRVGHIRSRRLVSCDRSAYPSTRAANQGGINVVQYIQTMMRKEPITLLVMCLMIAILIFGLWDILHVVKR